MRAKRAEFFFEGGGLYPHICHSGGVQQVQREAYGEPIGSRCYNILLVVSWASIIGWTGGQVPPLFEVGDVTCFVPPAFGATNIYYV